MSAIVGTVLLAFGALLSAFTTLTAAAWPERFARSLGLTAPGAGGRNEIRSQYAGFFLAVAIACLLALLGYVPRSSIYPVLLVTFGGLFVGRMVSLIGNGGFGGFGPVVSTLCFIDAFGFATSVAAIWPGAA